MRNAKLGVLVLGVMTAAACSSPESKEQVKEADPADWTVVDDAKLGTPSYVAPPKGAGPRVLSPNVDADVATLRFLSDHRAKLGLRAPKDELVKVRANVDALSMTHVRLRQVERGVPVVGAEVLAHYDRSGRLTSVQQHYVPGLATLDLAPAVVKSAASQIAIDDSRRLVRNTATIEAAAGPTLVVLARGAKPVLAWQVDVRSGLRHAWQVSVDAKSGAVVERIDQVEDIAGSGVALDGKTRPLEFAQSQDGQNVLADISRDVRIITRDSTGTQALAAPLFTSDDGTSWDLASETAAGAAVDAHTNIATTTDFFAKTFARNGWDGKNGDMNVYVHLEDEDGAGLDNAFYSQASNIIAFGDGKAIFKPLAGALDVVGHEFTHAVIFNESQLVYQGQSGALNESIADVFGGVVEHAIKPDPVANWLIGEGLGLADGAPLRDMAAPNKHRQPRHMNEFVQTTTDNGGVHTNSGIPNQAAFLATVGGTNAVSNVTVKGGIGWDNLARVWYRANDTYLTSSSDFAAMAKATLLAAADLNLAQKDVDTLDCAWKAVGVTQGACAVVAEPATVPDTGVETAPPTAETIPPTPETVVGDADGEDTDDEKSAVAPSKKKSKRAKLPDEEPASAAAGCSASPGTTDAPWPVLFGVVVGVASLLRRRRVRGS